MSNNIKNKNLANLIKADLQDILTNDSRWDGHWIFNDYFMMVKDIWVDTKKEEIEEATAENARQNYNKRKQKWEKKKQEHERQGKEWYGTQFNLNERKIRPDELENTDYNEIVSLINQARQLWERKSQQRQREIEEKLDSNPRLYYYSGRGVRQERASSWFDYGDKKGGYLGMLARENGRGYGLNIVESHPVLDTFSFQKGFYLIDTDKPVERNDGIIRPWSDRGENNPNNFHKWIEIRDNITITPYEIEDSSKLLENWKKDLNSNTKRKHECDICHKKLSREGEGSDNFLIMKRYHGKANIGGPVAWVCLDCYQAKEQEYLQNHSGIYERFVEKDGSIDYRLLKAEWIDCYEGKKDQNGKILKQTDCSHCSPWKQQEISDLENKKIINFLISYFQQHNIKKITFKNGELVITHNNNEIINNTDSSEYQVVKNSLQKIGKNAITQQELRDMINANSVPSSAGKPNNSNALLIGGSIILVLVGIGIGLLISKKKQKKNK